MKKNFFFLLFLFFFFTLSNKISANINCDYKSNSVQNYNQHKNIKYLEVSFENNRDWIVNSLKIGIGNFRFIPENYKKNFNGTIKAYYENKTTCNHKARIRFSGDMKDHVDIDLTNNKINQSIDVKLLEGNILGITNFKLLLKRTRGEDEIFITELLKNFGFLTPRTYLTKVKMNNQITEMLFQEKNRKELLEFNKRRETVILEGDERFIFLTSQNIPLDHRSNHAAGLVPLLKEGFKAMLAKQKNSSLVLRNKNLETMSINALTNLNLIYLKYLNNFDKNSNQLESYRFYTLDNELLGFKNEKNILFLDLYNLIIMAASDGHSIMPSNRQFYWNSFEQFFEPVSYDGNFNIKNNPNYLIEPLSENFLESFNNFDELINTLNINEFNRNLNDNGLRQSLNETERKLENLKANVKKLQSKFVTKKNKKLLVKDDNLGSLEEYVKNLKKINKGIKIVKINSKNYFELCNDLQNCQIVNFSKEQIRNLLRAELEVAEKQIQFVGKIDNSKNLIKNLNFKKKKFKNTEIFHDKNIEVVIDEVTNQINIVQKESNTKIIFLGGILRDLQINFNGSKSELASGSNKEYNPVDINGLTGCVSFINMAVDNLKLVSENSNCEDSINFINTTGSIDKITIKNSFSDGLDIDFSKLIINTIEIENANNDCSDFSFGDYVIKKMKLSNCGDKAISVGEKSILSSDFAMIRNSNIGVASKDSSEVYIKSASLSTVDTCLAAYNKKQEFLGGVIDIKNLDCEKFSNLSNKDKISDIIIKNKDLHTNLNTTFNLK